MTFLQELNSWMSPPALQISPVPKVGSAAPLSSKLPVSNADGKPTIISFLRHCGCPFSEKTILELRELANQTPDVTFIAISHSDSPATEKWLAAVGGAGLVSVVVDPERELYAQWGLGISTFTHVLNLSSMFAAWKLGREHGIWNRPTESGSRWQTAGSFAVDGKGVVRWARVAEGAGDVLDFKCVLETVGVSV